MREKTRHRTSETTPGGREEEEEEWDIKLLTQPAHIAGLQCRQRFCFCVPEEQGMEGAPWYVYVRCGGS